MEPIRFPFERLRAFVAGVFIALGAPPEHAGITADRLLEADMRGRDGHGIIRALLYSKRIRAGAYNLEPHIEIVHETPVSALIDGDNGIGQVVMTVATEQAIQKAVANGMAWVGTRNSNHAGAGGVYPALALEHDLVAIYLAVGNANTMPPWGGLDPLLGTNPLAVAIPAGEEPAIQLDMATTATSHGTVKVAAMAGESIPEGWMVDREGNPITDPRLAGEGFLLPIGAHKGFGLNVVIGLLSGVMNGAAFGDEVIDHRVDWTSPTNSGQALFVMRPDLFQEIGEFKRSMDRHIRALRNSTPMPGKTIRMPGEEARRRQDEAMRIGVPVRPALLSELQELAAELGLDDRLD